MRVGRDQVNRAFRGEAVTIIPSPGPDKVIVIDDYDGLGTVTFHVEPSSR
jgi:hypothetical protein